MIGGRKFDIVEAACEFQCYPVKAGQVFIEVVVAFFEMDVLKNEEAGRHAKGKAGDVQDRIDFVF